jgi:hypothetical protein
MNDELLKQIISDLAQGILSHEYAKDMRNETALRMLADGQFERYEAMKNGERDYR